MQQLPKQGSALKRCIDELSNDATQQMALMSVTAVAFVLSLSFTQLSGPSKVEQQLRSTYSDAIHFANTQKDKLTKLTTHPATPWLHPELISKRVKLQTEQQLLSKRAQTQALAVNNIDPQFLIDITAEQLNFSRRYFRSEAQLNLAAKSIAALSHNPNGRMHFGQLEKKAQTATPTIINDNALTVIIDPGHGGVDPGAVSHNGLEEKALTLDIASRVVKLLANTKGVNVVLTRNHDEGLSRQERLDRVTQSNADLIVSLHLNHLPQTEINLVETYYAGPKNIAESLIKRREKNASGMVKMSNANSAQVTPSGAIDLSFTKGSKKLANLLQSSVFKTVHQSNPDTENAGVKQDTLYMLTRSFTPGVLIELSCLSNAKEAALLSNESYRNRLATALAEGIRDYVTSPDFSAKNDIEA